MLDSVKKGTYTLRALFAQHNEHRMFFPKLIAIAVAFMTSYNSKALMLMSMVIVTVMYCLCVRYIFRSNEGQSAKKYAFSVAVGLMLFHSVQYENILWGFQTAWFLISMCVVICFIQVGRLLSDCRTKNLVILIVFAVVASFSSLHGLFVWLVIDALLVLALIQRYSLKKSVYLAVGVAQILCFILYFATYKKPAHHPAYLQNGIFVAFEYYLSTLGRFFFKSHSLSLLAGGFVFLASCAFLLLAAVKKDFVRENALPLGLICFGNLFALSLSVGRSGFGVDQAFSSRYTTNTLLIMVGLTLCAMPLISRNIGRSVTALSWAVALGAGLLVLRNPFYLGIYQGQKSSRLTDAYYILNYRTEDLSKRPATSIVAQGAMYESCVGILEEHGWNVFSPSSEKEIGRFLDSKKAALPDYPERAQDFPH